MNFLDSKNNQNFLQNKISTINFKKNICSDQDKHPIKLMNTQYNNYENKSRVNKNNVSFNPENIDFNNLLKNVNEEKTKSDKPLVTNKYSLSIKEVLNSKPASSNFIKSMNLSKSCTKFELNKKQNKMNTLNFIYDDKNNFEVVNLINNDDIEKNEKYGNFSICDYDDIKNSNRKLNFEIENQFDNDILDDEENIRFIHRDKNNLNQQIKNELKDIDGFFLNDENENIRQLENDFNLDNKIEIIDEINSEKGNFQKGYLEEDINREIKILETMRAELRRMDTLSTNDIPDKDNPGIFSEVELEREIQKVKSQKTTDVLQIMIELLSNFAENSRNSDKQSVMEIAQSNEDLEAVCLLYDYILKRRNNKIIRNKDRAKNFLAKTPNFYMEMKWEVNVKVPLVSYFCPNDVFKIWKFDQNVRMDYTFVEFKNLSSVRCPSSWYFLGGFGKISNTQNKENFNLIRDNSINSKENINKKKDQSIKESNGKINLKNMLSFSTKDQQNSKKEESQIFQFNWKTNTYFNPFEEFEEGEKKLIIKDIMNSHRIHGEFKLKDCAITESVSSWSKKPVYEKINGWNAKKYEVSLTAFVNLHNKEKFFYQDFNKEDYFDIDKPLLKKIVYAEDKENTKKNIADGFKVKNDKMRDALIKISDNKDKKLKAYVWIAENFPIKSSSLTAVIDSVSNANEFTKKIKEFLKDKEVKKIIDNNGFPIKIIIPVNFLVDVTVKFNKFSELNSINEAENLFKIPNNVNRISRKEAQKLDINQKKRIRYANIQ